jgi:hypothetical protein
MRKKFIECKTRKTAERRAPWALFFVKVDGGYMAFESMHDYDTWTAQQ